MTCTEWIIELTWCATQTEDHAVFNIAQDADSERTQNITTDMNIAKDAFPAL